MTDPTLPVAVVCDNTMGIPGGEIDDGLALLYLRGCAPEGVRVELVATTHGNAPTADTDRATRWLCKRILPEVPVLRGSDASAPGEKPTLPDGAAGAAGGPAPASEAARGLVKLAWERGPGTVTLLSLGATTELAAAERLRPGTLARFGGVCLMGGLTRALVVGGRIMDELNFSVDTRATREVLATARTGARLRIADAQDCLPLRFDGGEFLGRLGTGEKPGAELVRTACEPWIERTRETRGVDGFIGWDVLAAVAAAHPEEVELLPRRVVLNRRFLEVGLLEEADPEVPEELTAPVELVHVRDGAALREHVYRTWERGLGQG